MNKSNNNSVNSKILEILIQTIREGQSQRNIIALMTRGVTAYF
jgi:hypothetical protein